MINSGSRKFFVFRYRYLNWLISSGLSLNLVFLFRDTFVYIFSTKNQAFRSFVYLSACSIIYFMDRTSNELIFYSFIGLVASSYVIPQSPCFEFRQFLNGPIHILGVSTFAQLIERERCFRRKVFSLDRKGYCRQRSQNKFHPHPMQRLHPFGQKFTSHNLIQEINSYFRAILTKFVTPHHFCILLGLEFNYFLPVFPRK